MVAACRLSGVRWNSRSKQPIKDAVDESDGGIRRVVTGKHALAQPADCGQNQVTVEFRVDGLQRWIEFERASELVRH